MTGLPPIDLTTVRNQNQPPQRPKARADFGAHVPQQRQSSTDQDKTAQAQASRSTLATASASTPPSDPNGAPKAAADVAAAPSLPTQDAAWHEALAPVRASLAMPGLSGRIYPESLRVIGYLSMLDAVDGAAAKAGEAAALPLLGQGVVRPLPGMMPATKADIISGTDAHIDLQALAEATAQVQAHDGSEATEASGQGGGASGAQVEWLHRLIRIEGDTATLWIRDFRLDEPQKQALATRLRDYARTTGSPVRRVMVNGEELWRADAGKDGNNKGASYGR